MFSSVLPNKYRFYTGYQLIERDFYQRRWNRMTYDCVCLCLTESASVYTVDVPSKNPITSVLLKELSIEQKSLLSILRGLVDMKLFVVFDYLGVSSYSIIEQFFSSHCPIHTPLQQIPTNQIPLIAQRLDLLSLFCSRHCVYVNHLSRGMKFVHANLYKIIRQITYETQNFPMLIDFDLVTYLCVDLMNFFESPPKFIVKHFLNRRKRDDIFECVLMNNVTSKRTVTHVFMCAFERMSYISPVSFQHLLHVSLPDIGTQALIFLDYVLNDQQVVRVFSPRMIRYVRWARDNMVEPKYFVRSPFSDIPRAMCALEGDLGYFDYGQPLSEFVPLFTGDCRVTTPTYREIRDVVFSDVYEVSKKLSIVYEND